MSTISSGSLFGQLPPKGGLKEKLNLGILTPIVFFNSGGAPVLIGGSGYLWYSNSPLKGFSIGFFIALAIIAFVQTLASWIAFTSIANDTIYLPKANKAKRLMAPVSYPILIALIPFEVVAIVIFRVDAFLFVIQSSFLLLFSGGWSTVVWFRLRKAEKLPRVG